MRFYLYAFCLDEGKAKEGHEEMLVGPFEWLQITWDWLRAGDHEGNDEDHQFVRDENGYWYPLAYVSYDGGSSGSMQPDHTRGRFSDLSMVTAESVDEMIETAKNYGMVLEATRTTSRITDDQAALDAAREAEKAWMETYEG